MPGLAIELSHLPREVAGAGFVSRVQVAFELSHLPHEVAGADWPASSVYCFIIKHYAQCHCEERSDEAISSLTMF